mmetsp:Transcript_18649/g.40064  ORF Transcript_18649/g.40064 Transcript_18649/m.40064 type:complete len:216 (-) Transcript_18649:50-697(-)|eukprot:CAMPEP_0202900592 /NCGR_PEP_ID=MMETSP1392-20130828/11926_1 /ASSEMBLY_ACC=CAM_ASM_000868 /TAXON_ID=225041 /ORGANISM="Chlamydomonas chlamydogama, Strain SAG 11-48b" /LENGTH=215 /DNA_ID=CAMNT_0049587009 /DNA_START=75 /DNA_END=722 /DNA_ORIENTATION=-
MASAAYTTLGLTPSASKDQVKEAFRKLCLQYHPDKCADDIKPIAEAKFRQIKNAYDSILKGQAGYAPPPPGTAASSAYAEAWSRAHGMDMGGPPKVGGPFGGYATEFDFYRSMFRTSRNNPFLLIVTGLLCIPAIATVTSILNGNTAFISRFKNEGIHMFSEGRYKVNGRSTLNNPFSIRSLDNMADSYIYKSEKYKHLRKPEPAEQEGELRPAM